MKLGRLSPPPQPMTRTVMGDAKQRKRSDPNYGRIPKDAEHRGLVVSPPLEIEGGSIRLKQNNMDPVELRFALLFWDRLVWPCSDFIQLHSNQDEQFLETAGILRRQTFHVDGNVAQAIAHGQIQTYLDLENAQPGVWALAQGENSFLFKEGFAEAGTGALVELHRAIPIPAQSVPFAEILEFKQRRNAELTALRYHLDSFVREIEISQDKSLALQQRVAEIDQACANLLILCKEWQFPVLLSDFKASINFNVARSAASMGFAWNVAAPLGHLTATAAAAAIGAASIIDIKADYSLRSIKRPLSPYRYASHAHEELQ
jgi:hypothetical protein